MIVLWKSNICWWYYKWNFLCIYYFFRRN